MERKHQETQHKNRGFGNSLTAMRKSMLTQVALPVLPPELDTRTLERLFEAHPAPELAIRHLLKDGSLIRVRRGIYASNSLFQARPYELGVLAAMLHSPSCVSAETALYKHGFIKTAPEGCTSICPGRSRSYESSLGMFTFRHLGPERYQFGAHTVRLVDGNSFLMADPEKALLDAICMRTQVRSLKRLKMVIFDEMKVDPAELKRLDQLKLKVYARRYQSALAVNVLVPWIQSLKQ